MADPSPRPDSPLLSQLQTTLAQLEQVVQQLDANPEQGQSLTDETFDRLQSSLNTLRGIGTKSPVMPSPPSNQTALDNEWDEVFVDSFPSQPDRPVKPRSPSSVTKPQTERRSPPIPKSSTAPRQPKAKYGILTVIATGLLGILVGIGLWIGIPPLDVPPLWDQIASRMPPLSLSPATKSTATDPDLAPEGSQDPLEVEPGLPPVLEAPAPPTAIAIEPLPEAPLTPEQSLLAVIQQELVDLEGLYPPQLIQRIEPNFPASRLTLTIGTNWDQLSAKQQQSLLDALWQRAQKLSFTQLRLYAPEGDLIARSPVVGDAMVVLQASNPLVE
ncbi:MAG: hypothetical protein VKL20_00440 [Synechocystis sp.]|nr:hypothetical protein [Synechocystis sp.]